MKKILITDSLFIFPEHEQQLRDAGFELERLDKPKATEEELIQAVIGKEGYILGGIEQVTDKVIEAADKLEAIVFTGADWEFFIPGHKLATDRGVGIANAPGANSYAVAEYALTNMMAMIRNTYELTRVGDKSFSTTKSMKDLTVGIIGMGRIGSQLTSMLRGIEVKDVIYNSREEKDIDATFMSIEDVFKNSDIVSLHIPKVAGEGFITEEMLASMKDDSLLINCTYTKAVDVDFLYKELESGRLRAFHDEQIDERFDSLSKYNWINSNHSAAYNTHEANRVGSDMAVSSIINLLNGEGDENKVN